MVCSAIGSGKVRSAQPTDKVCVSPVKSKSDLSLP